MWLPLFVWFTSLCWAQGQTIDDVSCGIGASACTCSEFADVCQFSMEISSIYTFARYTINDNNVRQSGGKIYIIDNGTIVPWRSNSPCQGNCTEALTVDGKTFRTVIAVNSQFPGPTLVVHEDQTVIVNVKNNLTDQDISVHWHGMFQRNTPWMDGVGLTTQCPIGIGNKFRYIFKASPTGTFWYHSHSSAQRGDGLFGGLIIMEKNITRNYEDLPQNHTITLLDWHTQSSLDIYNQLHSLSAEQFFEGVSLGAVPTKSAAQRTPTVGPDGTEVGPVPFESGLINGRGRHPDVQYTDTFLSIFEVEEGKKYRFRLIGSQVVYGYRFSIDEHRLSLIALDGFLIEPVNPVDFIIIYSGERYDFVLEANRSSGNYWIRAETLEVNQTGSPPYMSLNHNAEAILHYSGTPPPTPTEYQSIISTPRECSELDPCVAINCPFKNYHVSYNITCINVHEFRLQKPTPENVIPAAVPDSGQEYFFNFGFDGPNNDSSINARVFDLPPFPLQTQGENLTGSAHTFCPQQTTPDVCEDGCSMCVHIHNIPFNNTIRFVLSSVSKFQASHPIHLHGHSFQVLDIGYGSYSDVNGSLIKANSNVSCNGNEKCPMPSWSNGFEPTFSIDARTIRKDTIIVPAGGYVVLHFISNNPGYWFMHCHIEVHQLEGMTQIINEALENQNPPPDGFQRCGDFNLTLEEFNKKLNFTTNPTPPTTAGINPGTNESTMFCSCLDRAELVVTVTFVTLGSILIVAGSVAVGMVICYSFYKKKGYFTPKNPITPSTGEPTPSQQPTEEHEMTTTTT